EIAWREPFGVAETPAEYVFLRPKLYLDTTIPSYLTAWMSRDVHIARLQRITSRWWSSWRTNFDIYISEYVAEEAARGDPEAAKRRLQLLTPLKSLDFNDHSSLLRERIMKECGLPPRASTDAAHVAVASVHGMQYLLTWNHTHLVNCAFTPSISA